MPEKVTQLDASKDPATTKQYDNESSAETKFNDFYELVDKLNITMMGTYRNGVGPVTRSMAVAKRSGPNFLFLSNANSQKFKDIEANKEVNLSFEDSSKHDWISVTGEAVTASNDDPRIKEIWSKPIAIWFGDVGDGVHNGGPEDPRMKLIEIQPKYITYYKRTTGTLGFGKEVVGSLMTGGVANTGDLREMHEDEIKQARSQDATMSK